MKLLITNFSLNSCNFLPPSSKYSPQYFVPKSSRHFIFSSVRNKAFYPYQIRGKLKIYYTLTPKFLDRR